MWASATNPQDGGVWLDCNGQSCTAYPRLVAIVGNNVPDLQGLFPRCVGSQDLSVTIDGTTTTQTFNGGSVGDKTADAIRNITGTADADSLTDLDGFSAVTGAFYNGERSTMHNSQHADNGKTYALGFDASKVVPVGVENKPVSVSLRFLIKAE